MKKYKIPLKLTVEPDSIANNESGRFRALMSCGHSADPNSLTEWMIKLLNDGEENIYCPALILSSNKMCKRIWDNDEISSCALLTLDEKDYFETKLNENSIKRNPLIKQCPNCDNYIERDPSIIGLKTKCVLCFKICSQDFSFCWKCGNKWESSRNSNVSCGRGDCKSMNLKILENCKFIKLSACPKLDEIPSIRACPSCGILVEHSGLNCKNIACQRCNISFCFACLEKTEVCSKFSGHYGKCSKPIEPIQRSIVYCE